jgi:hypothetical protein
MSLHAQTLLHVLLVESHARMAERGHGHRFSKTLAVSSPHKVQWNSRP